jgi:hypothetical protein
LVSKDKTKTNIIQNSLYIFHLVTLTSNAGCSVSGVV